MKKLYILYVAFFATLSIYSQTSVGDIIITEIMNNPSKVTDANGEYFEIYNTTSNSININGWVIEDHNSTHTISSMVNVPSHSYVVLGVNSDFSTNGGINIDYEYPSSIGLVNSGSEGYIAIKDETIEVDRVHYTNSSFPNSSGYSKELGLNKFDSVSNDNGENWGNSISTFGDGDYGTPGSENGFTLSTTKNNIEGFAVYPNPVENGFVSIQSRSNLTKEVEIYSLIGKLVFKSQVSNNTPINVANLSTGFYMMHVRENDKISVQKIIIK